MSIPRHIILTGPPGVGKTTAVQKVCESLKQKNIKIQGFFTEEVRAGSDRIGFDVVTIDNERSILSRAGQSFGNARVGKYSVNISAFEDLALPLFNASAPSVLILDEIGKMELCSHKFVEKVSCVFDNPDIKILATIPVKDVHPLVKEIRNRKDCTLIQITRQNRDNMPKEIIQKLTG